MLELKNLHLAFGGDRLFENINAFIGIRERIGLIGANGAGKTTLFKLITADMRPDQGQLDWQRGKSIGILKQELEFPESMPLLDFIKTAQGDLNEIDRNIKRLERELENTPVENWEKQTKLAEDLHIWQERKRLLGAGKFEAKAEKIAQGLGYRRDEFQKPLEAFSGGWKMRAELGRLLLMQPDLLLLDEPTNHLDIYSIIWLEKWLSQYEGSVIFISHDAQFLDNVAKRIWELEHRKLSDFTGTYNKYLLYKSDSDIKKRAAAENQDKRLKELQRTVDRFRAKASKAKMAQSLEKMIQKEERIEVDPVLHRKMSMRWPSFHPGGRETVTMKNIGHTYDGSNLVFNHANVAIERNEKIAFVGKNGTGKSTMAKIMVGRLNPSEGDVKLGYKVEPYYFDQYASDKLDPKMTVLESVEMAGSGLTTGELRSLLGSFMFSGEHVHKKTKVLSGGEKNRLALALMMLAGSNFLVLDEPTNHLDMFSRGVLKDALENYPGTLVVVSHDRTFLSGLTDRTYFFDYGRVTNYLGDINYVLEKEEAENIRELEVSEKRNEVGEPPKEVDKSAKQEQFALRKKLKSVEQRLVRLEEKKSAIEIDMSFPDFYEQDNAEVTMSEYAKIKKDILELNEAWESLAEKIT